MIIDPKQHQRIAGLFERACELEAGNRERFLRDACRTDEALYRAVMDLLELDADPADPLPLSSTWEDELDAFLKRVDTHTAPESRYRVESEVARGGMGAIWRVWDEDLGRPAAMKFLLGEEPGAGQAADARALRRFLEEAKITGQLEHPGVVPVHELGRDVRGRVYFTMKLVGGDDFATVIEHVHAGAAGWTLVRALGVVQRVCEAMAYAHERGVIHRDLKPGNVMVGRFGEVYVMDWGLARVVGREDRRDTRLAPARTGAVIQGALESPVVTMDGAVLGTPSYMPPEQAAGRTSEVAAHSDVYSVGAVLYHLLTGLAPYVETGVPARAYDVVERILREGPRPLAQSGVPIPAELTAIVEKAMARDPVERYSDMQGLGEDLRAFLENRVVSAHRTGPVIEFRKWVERNRALALTAAAATTVLLVGSLTASAVFAASSQRERTAREGAEWSGYTARIAAAFVDVQGGNHENARRRLADGPAGLRAWEWEYLMNAAHERSELVLEASSTSVRWDPSGSFIALNNGGRPQLLSAATGESVEFLTGRAFASDVDWSPAGDRLVASSPDGALRIWRAGAGEPPLSTIALGRGVLVRVLWAPSGERLATSGPGTDLIIVDALTGERVAELDTERLPPRGGANSFDWSPDGSSIVSAGTTGPVVVWNVDTDARLALGTFIEGMASVAWSPDGALIATGWHDATIRVCAAGTGELLSVLGGHREPVTALAWAPDSARLVSGSDDRTVRVWDLDEGREQRVFLGHTSGITSVDWSPDGSRVVSVSSLDKGRIWDVESEDRSTGRELRHGRAKSDVAISADGSWLVTVSEDQTIRLSDRIAGTDRVMESARDAGTGVEWSPVAEQFAVGATGNAVQVWDARQARVVATFRGHTDTVEDVSWEPNGERLASCARDGTLRIWDVAAEQQVRSMLLPVGTPHDVAWSPTRPWVACVAGGSPEKLQSGPPRPEDRGIHLWNVDTGEWVATLASVPTVLIEVEWSPDGERLAAGGIDAKIHIWDVARRTSLDLIGHDSTVEGIAWNSDGSRIASCSRDGTVRVWDPDSGQSLLTLPGEGRLTSIAWTPDDSSLVAVSELGVMFSWKSR